MHVVQSFSPNGYGVYLTLNIQQSLEGNPDSLHPYHILKGNNNNKQKQSSVSVRLLVYASGSENCLHI